MEIQIKWFNDQFNVALASKEGAEPFIEVKGARIVNGKNGPFVSWPATKKADGKFWNHVYGSERFNAAVLERAQATQPAAAPARQRAAAPDDDIPFRDPLATRGYHLAV